MDRDTFNRMVTRYRAMARVNPEAYERAVRKVVREGYLLIGVLMVLGLGLLGGVTLMALVSPLLLVLLFKLKVGFLLIPVLWAVIRSLFVRYPPPEGYPLSRASAPALFETLDGLQQQLDTPRVNQVLLIPDFNAFIAVEPRFGWFGPPRVTLSLGLELLMSTSEAQARSVLAHELGHLTRRNWSLDRRVYWLRRTWSRLYDYFDRQQGWSTAPIRKALENYVPRLQAITHAAAQREEYKADSVSARLTTPGDAASALTVVNVLEPYLREYYWERFGRQAVRASRPKMGAWAGLSTFWRSETLPGPVFRRLLNQALHNETDVLDTHPCLADRLKHLGQPPGFVLADRTAAEAWLSPCLNEIVSHFDRLWWDAVQDRWTAAHEAGKQAREALHALLRGRRWHELSVQELREAVPHLEALCQDDAVRRVSEVLYRHDPSDADNRLRLTRLQARDNEPACLQTARTLLEDVERATEACYWVVFYLKGLDHIHPEQQWWEGQWQAASERAVALEAAFENLQPSDTIVVPDLPPGALEEIRSFAARLPDARQLWIARRILPEFGQVPCYLLVVRPRNGFVETEELAAQIAQAIPLSCRLHVLSEDMKPAQLVKPLCRAVIDQGVPLK
ncbi:M48 family metalloprotease [Hahella sp. SMD15-11]|uniref:M48 family metalloprotease n=1 Tax=Thermohahella caldifontis TaxID=3142973 RepID=A0AB39V0X5_9GAMM